MTAFILARLARALIVLALALTFVFIILRISGDPAEQMLGDLASPEAIAVVRANWGLDKPLPEQFVIYVGNLLHGDFGVSTADGRPVFTIIAERVPKTLAITVTSLLLTILFGVPIGILAALKRESAADRSVMSAAVVGYSVPNFLLGVGLIFLFAVWLRVLPSSGSSSWQHAVLPILTSTLAGAAGISRFVRSAMIDVLDQPYVAAARADGIPEWEIVLRHALPNAAIPLVTLIGFSAGGLLGGSVLVETVFAWPGLGSGFVQAVTLGNLTVVQAMVITFTLFMVTINLTVDVLYAVLNPKIRLQ